MIWQVFSRTSQISSRPLCASRPGSLPKCSAWSPICNSWMCATPGRRRTASSLEHARFRYRPLPIRSKVWITRCRWSCTAPAATARWSPRAYFGLQAFTMWPTCWAGTAPGRTPASPDAFLDGEVLAVPHTGFRRPDHAPSRRAAVVLGLQFGDPGEQRLQAHADQVGHHRVVPGPRMGAADDLTGNPDHHSAGGHFLDHDGVGADPAVVANLDRAENLGSGADDHPVADRRMPFAGIPAAAAERDAVIDHYVFAHFRRFPDHYAGRVVNEQAGAEGRARVDVYSGQNAGQFREGPRGHPCAAIPEPVADAMAPDRVHTRVSEDHLQRARVGRIALPCRGYVTPNRREHG